MLFRSFTMSKLQSLMTLEGIRYLSFSHTYLFKGSTATSEKPASTDWKNSLTLSSSSVHSSLSPFIATFSSSFLGLVSHFTCCFSFCLSLILTLSSHLSLKYFNLSGIKIKYVLLFSLVSRYLLDAKGWLNPKMNLSELGLCSVILEKMHRVVSKSVFFVLLSMSSLYSTQNRWTI